jgi:putative phosphoesterase
MRVALISDLHGSELALEAVLADAARVGYDRLVCLGDVATLGPRPVHVLDRLADLGCPCILGNHDDFLLDPALLHTYTEAPPVVRAVEWCHAELSARHRTQLAAFQPSLSLDLDGRELWLFHGSPRSHMENLLATSPPEALDEALGGRQAPVMAGGHTHLQMVRQHRGSWLVNPGSVALPIESFVGGGKGGPPTVLSHAEYAIVEASAGGVAVMLRRVDMDRGALLQAARSAGGPIEALLAPAYS